MVDGAEARAMPPDPGADPAREAISTGPPRMTPLRELQLVKEWREGDPAALAELLTGYQRRIYGVCSRMVRDREDAADLTQEALIKVIEGISSYDARARLSTWIIRVTMNCCLSHLRKQRLRQHASLDEGDDEGTPRGVNLEQIGEPSSLARVEQAEAQRVLLCALEQIEPPMRAILVLRDLQELDYQQIAEVLEVPVGTVKSRLFRARAALREEVETLLADSKNEDTGAA